MTNKTSGSRFDLEKLVRIIGYQLTAYIGRTNVGQVRDWLLHGLPEHLEERMQAVLDVARPIAEAEFELVAQNFLISKQDGIEPYRYPARMLRDTADVPAARVALIEMVRREYLLNVADNLEEVERRLLKWIADTRILPPYALQGRDQWGQALAPADPCWIHFGAAAQMGSRRGLAVVERVDLCCSGDGGLPRHGQHRHRLPVSISAPCVQMIFERYPSVNARLATGHRPSGCGNLARPTLCGSNIRLASDPLPIATLRMAQK